jgi:hypothetical protein
MRHQNQRSIKTLPVPALGDEKFPGPFNGIKKEGNNT